MHRHISHTLNVWSNFDSHSYHLIISFTEEEDIQDLLNSILLFHYEYYCAEQQRWDEMIHMEYTYENSPKNTIFLLINYWFSNFSHSVISQLRWWLELQCLPACLECSANFPLMLLLYFHVRHAIYFFRGPKISFNPISNFQSIYSITLI